MVEAWTHVRSLIDQVQFRQEAESTRLNIAASWCEAAIRRHAGAVSTTARAVAAACARAVEKAGTEQSLADVATLLSSGGNLADDPATITQHLGSPAATSLFEGFKAIDTVLGLQHKILLSLQAAAQANQNVLGGSWMESAADAFATATDTIINDLSKPGLVMGNLTAAQALLRQLQPGESRAGLAKRCLKGYSKKSYFKCSAPLEKQLRAAMGEEAAK
eukprot:2024784-Alexandrium_andersonii.AAC.1